MNTDDVKMRMQNICNAKKWRNLVDFIEEGYKGMFVILRIVKDSGKPVIAGDLAKIMNVSTARIARALNTLERKGYVERRCFENDARKVVIVLTELGAAALSERENRVSNMLTPMLNRLTESEVKSLFGLLGKVLS